MNGNTPFAPRAAAGLSLVELMISIALAAIILAGVVKLYADSHRSALANEGVARTQESIRYVLDHISRAAARAGYMGCTQMDDAAGVDVSTLENLVDVTSDAGRLYDFSSGPVFGTDNNGANSSDTLILRSARAANGFQLEGFTAPLVVHADQRDDFAASSLTSGDVVVAGDCSRIRVFMMTNEPGASGQVLHAKTTIDGVSNADASFDGESNEGQGSLIMLFPATGASVEYRIGDSVAGACDADNPRFCALLANNQELLQGVEDLQVLYGMRSGGQVRYREADDTAIDWQDVVSVQLTVTLNSVDNSFTGEGDGLLRKEVTHVIALRNGDL